MRTPNFTRNRVLYGFLVLSLGLAANQANLTSNPEQLDLSSRSPAEVRLDASRQIEARIRHNNSEEIRITGEIRNEDIITHKTDENGILVQETKTVTQAVFRPANCSGCEIEPLQIGANITDLEARITAHLEKFAKNHSEKEEQKKRDREALARDLENCTAAARVNGRLVYSIDQIPENADYERVSLTRNSRRTDSSGPTRLDCQVGRLASKDEIRRRDVSGDLSTSLQTMLLSQDEDERELALDYIDSLSLNSEESLYRSLLSMERGSKSFHNLLSLDQTYQLSQNPWQRYYLGSQINNGILQFQQYANGIRLDGNGTGPMQQAALCFTGGSAAPGTLSQCASNISSGGSIYTTPGTFPSTNIGLGSLNINNRTQRFGDFAGAGMPQQGFYNSNLPTTQNPIGFNENSHLFANQQQLSLNNQNNINAGPRYQRNQFQGGMPQVGQHQQQGQPFFSQQRTYR